ncbi:uncharacterized protein PITG_01118 [Phytophthora infestans T30-4]|uniref:Uncharacterized protein n=1 Tax=Phytophthora infestans (strain T30-4) TaxID=403677 RepID=D0MSI2_PHYIT|nr:uncharacterized protein PITG_01118 [Phytophthora infestans T30-4]EEY58451.1 conserved hypothetical protein [Phytophthora infestans T30-4]|eukprot:XP_002909637.1 conserved hypothetical protein [Phytophthora infestans T30-4]
MTLQLQVHALQKYKSNYELLCGQLSDLNTQIGLQLQRHEADVSALQASIADLETEKIGLEAEVLEARHALAMTRDTAKQDREYSENIHRQLSTAAELLKATEKRLEQQEQHFTAEVERLKTQLAAGDDKRAEYQARTTALEEEIETLRGQERVAKEQAVLRRRRERSKHKKEVAARAATMRSLSDELEAQRSALRATKKQLGQVQADNDALRKQLTNVKRDGAHFSDIIDSQRAEHESYTDELMQTKKAKKLLAKRVTALSQEIEQLQTELADARDELVLKNNEIEIGRDEIKTLREVERERCTKAKTEEQEQRVRRDSKYRTEVLRMRELLEDNQRHATESSKGVQSLRRELLGVQKLLYGCAQAQEVTPEAIDQWAEVMRNSATAEEGVKTPLRCRRNKSQAL